MASLMEELISTLEQENELYEQLIPLSAGKTKVIVSNDVETLQKITEQEQDFLQQITTLEQRRREVIHNIGIVINRDPANLNIKELIKILDKQPNEQKMLCKVHDNLSKSVHELMKINNHNKSLIEQSLEMVEFNMNFIQSTWMSPGNNNYTKSAATTEAVQNRTRMFDAKQ